jgi:hypothetical protein
MGFKEEYLSKDRNSSFSDPGVIKIDHYAAGMGTKIQKNRTLKMSIRRTSV